jgi:NAD(P)H-hydrate epimerase
MTCGLPQYSDSYFEFHPEEASIQLLAKATSVAIGPGLGLGEKMASFVRSIIVHCPVPVVIDADALTLLSKEPDRGQSIVKNRKAATILTPHPGEMGRLLGIDTNAVQSDRRKALKMAVEFYGCVVLLKGARTLIADSSGTTYLNLTGNPGMSSGGMGDALTGVIASLLGQHLDALPAAAAGAFVHGLAGDLVKDKNGGANGISAMDLIVHMPQSIGHCQTHK